MSLQHLPSKILFEYFTQNFSIVHIIPDTLDSFLQSYPRSVRDLFEVTRNAVLDLEENVYEMIWDNYNALAVAYAPADQLRDAYCHIAVYSSHVNLGFNQGAHLPDPQRILLGEGALIRHIKVDSAEILNDKAVRRLIYEARSWSKQLNPWSKIPEGTVSIVKSISEKKRRPNLG